MRRPARMLATVLILCVAYVAPPALADGKFFRRVEVADEPGIAAQRAVLAFKDGVETLVVQSEVQSADTSYGWILPLPAEPTSIEPCPANTLSVLADVVTPRVVDLPSTLPWIALFLVLATFVSGMEHVRARHRGARSRAGVIAFAAVLLLGAVLIAVPTLSVQSGNADAGVRVLQTTKAGAYDVSVITGDSADAVEAWLKDNGFACPPAARAVLAEYVAEHWCFLAAKVSADAAGEALHHPLSVAFPAKRAVYPMKLTGYDGKPLQLDLFVIADRAASAAGLRSWLSDRFIVDDGYTGGGNLGGEHATVFTSLGRSVQAIGVPAVTDLMWAGCTLTRLHGRLSAAAMKSDIALDWSDAGPARAAVYDRTSALRYASSVAALAFVVVFIWLVSVAEKKRWSSVEFLRKRGAAVLLIVAAIGAARYFTLEVVPTRISIHSWIRGIVAVLAHRDALDKLAESPPEQPFPEAYRALLSRRQIEESADRDPEHPGDYRIEKTEDGWRLTVLDRNYVPVTIAIAPDGTPRR